MPPKKNPPAAPRVEEQAPVQQVIMLDFTPEVKELLRDLAIGLNTRPAINIVLPEQAAQPVQPAMGQAPAPKPKPEAVESSRVTLTQIRNVIVAKVAEGKTAALADTLRIYGAKNASTLAEDQYEAFYTQALNL